MKKLLIVVDYQVDFVNGTLGFDGADALAPKLAERIKAARAAGEDVIFTYDTHQSNYLETSEGRHLPVLHCIEGTPGHALFGEIAELVQPEDRLINKPSFGSEELFDLLRHSAYEIVELCGLVTDICVISNAILAKTALPEAEIIVNSALVDSFDKSKHAAALDVMRSVQITVL
ncbi:MAG: cysteine hydrolase [Ruminococcaceae bacterium]|nr:cysteine hydrolase [Oscillospiraceae bacterium]